jgi:hypothetical protein
MVTSANRAGTDVTAGVATVASDLVSEDHDGGARQTNLTVCNVI